MRRTRPKTVAPLSPDVRAALARRVAETSARRAARDLAVSDAVVRRALDGSALSLSLGRLLALQLSPSGDRNAAARAA